MCKDVQRFFYSEMVAPFLSFDGRGPSLCVELVKMNFGTWCLWAITDWLDLIGTGPVADQLYVIGGRDNNQAWWVGARLNSARLGSTDLVSVTDDDDNNQIWHDHIDHDMIWHDQLVQLKVPRIVLHITETHLTHRNRWMWSRCSTHGTESRWARWTIDIHRHPSTWTNTSWTVVQRCAALNICWAEVDHMPWNVGKEGRPGGDKMRRTSDEHLRKSWNLTLQATIIYNSSGTRGISWIWCCGMLWVGFLPGSQLELSVSCQPWVTGCAAAPLPNGCLIVCGGSCNVFFHVFPVDVSSCGAAMVRPA